MDDFAEQLLGVIDDFLTDQLHHATEVMEGNTGTVQSDDGTLQIELEDGRVYRLTITAVG